MIHTYINPQRWESCECLIVFDTLALHTFESQATLFVDEQKKYHFGVRLAGIEVADALASTLSKTYLQQIKNLTYTL